MPGRAAEGAAGGRMAWGAGEVLACGAGCPDRGSGSRLAKAEATNAAARAGDSYHTILTCIVLCYATLDYTTSVHSLSCSVARRIQPSSSERPTSVRLRSGKDPAQASTKYKDLGEASQRQGPCAGKYKV